jgi:hypothetical protein
MQIILESCDANGSEMHNLSVECVRFVMRRVAV